MKIVDTKVDPKKLLFTEIAKAGGNVFHCGSRANVFMTLGYLVCSPAGTEDYNAISLVNGDLVWFDCCDLVYPIEAELVLK